MLRAGLVPWAAVALVAVVGRAVERSAGCQGAQPWGCLGWGVIIVGAGGAFVAVLVTLALLGRGLLMALAGCAASLVGGYFLSQVLEALVSWPGGPRWEAIDWMVLATAISVVAVGWTLLPLQPRRTPEVR